MSLYSKYLFPRILDWSMGCSSLRERRASLIAQARGRVLEIGFGTARNLPFYPAHEIEALVGIDSNPGMAVLASPRVAAAPFRTEIRTASAEAMPAGDASFDCVVSTWTLCSIRNAGKALDEAYRVLRPGGVLLFVEHGLSPDRAVQRWQHRLEPVWCRLADGCHLSRRPDSLIQQAGFELRTCTESYLPRLPRWSAYTYQGVAVKPPGASPDASGSNSSSLGLADPAPSSVVEKSK